MAFWSLGQLNPDLMTHEERRVVRSLWRILRQKGAVTDSGICAACQMPYRGDFDLYTWALERVRSAWLLEEWHCSCANCGTVTRISRVEVVEDRARLHADPDPGYLERFERAVVTTEFGAVVEERTVDPGTSVLEAVCQHKNR